MAEKPQIKVTGFGDKSGDKKPGAKIDIYSPDVRTEPHDSIHIKIDTKTGKGEIIQEPKNGPKETTDTQCYLTTACMRHYAEEFDDNCYELTTLRKFRDTFVSEEDIAHYYEVAPAIVEAINQIPGCEKIYHYIYDNVIDQCVKAIEQGDYEFAYNRYKNSILAFEEEYAKLTLEKDKRKVLAISKPSFVY